MSVLSRFILCLLGLAILSSVGAFFIYRPWRAKQALPEHIQKNRQMETEGADFTVYDLNTKALSLSSLKGKVLIINFWATWCAPCVEELPSLNKLAESFPKKLIILAVSNERTDSITNFLMAFPVFHSNFIPANVSRKKMLSSFSVQAFPESYILDKTGKLTEKIIGPQKWDSPEWKEKIKQLIQK